MTNTVETSDILKNLDELANFLSQQNSYHSNSIACNDPIIKEHIGKLVTWERLVNDIRDVFDSGFLDIKSDRVRA